jgi:putative isomerase
MLCRLDLNLQICLRTFSAVLIMLAGAATAGAQTQSELSRFMEKHHAKQDIVKPPSGLLKHEYLVPAGPYNQLFDWDMYFMGVALSYDGVGKPVASSVESFLEFVDANANRKGYAPREISPDAIWALPEMCKPFLAQAALRASLTMNDFTWLSRANGKGPSNYVKLTETLQFWEETRRSPDGLFRWCNGVESGVDNNPAVSDNPAETTEGVDLQCYIYREYRALAVLARKLGKTADAAAYQQKAEALGKLVQQKMWSDADGMFLNIDCWSGKPIRIKTWTDLVPLWAGIATPDHAKRLIRDHVLNPREFWAPQGIRTLAPSEPLYDPEHGYWRGPIWVISNYMIMHGLMNYGYPKEAQELARKTVALLVRDYATSGGMNECYTPETGKPVAGGHFLSWNLLAEHMIEEAEKGTDPAAVPPQGYFGAVPAASSR